MVRKLTVDAAVSRLRLKFRGLGDAARAPGMRRFFKCGVGEYGEGDDFLGIGNPAVRNFHKENRTAFADCEAGALRATCTLVESPFNEERFLALLYLIDCFDNAQRAAASKRRKSISTVDTPNDEGRKDKTAEKKVEVIAAVQPVVDAYLQLAADGRVNNWNLVDLSAPDIVGNYALLLNNETRHEMLQRMVRRDNLWLRRIAVVGSLSLIRAGEFADTLAMCSALLDAKEPHDLMHKAAGWMLREVGKRDEAVLNGFLDQNATRMPRTMLRYSIERLPPSRRKVLMSLPSEVKKSTAKRNRDDDVEE